MNRRALLAGVTIVAGLAIAACNDAAPPSSPPATTAAAASPAEAATTQGSAGASADPGASPTQPASATPPAPSSGGAPGAASCAKDGDCGWDDPCQPRRCVAAGAAPPAAGCERSVSPEGSCVCFESRCAFRPTAARSPVSVETACTSIPGCVLDVGAGACAPGNDPDSRPLGEPGPHCRCDGREPRRCHYVWIDPVPCESDADCWVSEEDFTRPIARPRKLRGKRFRPCKDGERAPVCERGRCTVRGYTC